MHAALARPPVVAGRLRERLLAADRYLSQRLWHLAAVTASSFHTLVPITFSYISIAILSLLLRTLNWRWFSTTGCGLG